MKRSTRLAPIIGEALRDIASGTTHALALTILLALLTTVATGSDIISIARIEQQARYYVDSGGTTTILDYPGHIDGQACDRLSRIQGVLASGAIKTTNGKLTPAATPSSTIPSYEITPGAEHLFQSADTARNGNAEAAQSGGILLSQDAAEPLAVKPGSQLKTTDNMTARILDVYQWPDDGRLSTYGYAVLIPTYAAQAFDQCWIKTWPTPVNTNNLLRTSIADTTTDNSSGNTPKTINLNINQGSSLDTGSLYQQRLTAAVSPVMLTICFVLALIVTRTRRLEIASALHDGMPKISLATQHLIETLVWTLSAMLIAAAPICIMATHLIPITDLPVVLTDTFARTATAAITGTVIGTALAVLTIKERYLFIYFKNRQ